MTDRQPEQRADNWDRDARGYDGAVRAFTQKFARDAVDLAGVEAGARVLDVAAGTGAVSLCAAERGADVLATDFSAGMLEVLRENAAVAGLDGRIRTAVMDGQALTVEDASFDHAFSCFGLMMFPDRAAGFRELHRALAPGGRAAVAVWFGMDRLEFMQLVMGALVAAVPDFPMPSEPPAWLSIATADGLREEMRAGGFARVNVFSVRHLWTFESPEWLWDRLEGLAPGLDFVFEALDDAQRDAYRRAFVGTLRERMGEGPYALAGDANIAVGVKAGRGAPA